MTIVDILTVIGYMTVVWLTAWAIGHAIIYLAAKSLDRYERNRP